MTKEPSCVLKLYRASFHIEELDQGMRAWERAQAERGAFHIEADPENPGLSLVWIEVEEPPQGVPLILGDAIQNIRNALDHLVYSLAVQRAPHMSEREKSACEFPIVGDESNAGATGMGQQKFQSSTSLRNVSSQTAAIIQRFQPYLLGQTFREHPLWLLKELSNIDKHRTIHVVAALSKDFGFTFNGHRDPCVNTDDIHVYSQLLRGRALVARVPTKLFDMIQQDEQGRPSISCTVGLSLEPDPGSFVVRDIRNVLAWIYNYVSNEVFPPLLEQLRIDNNTA